MKRFFFFLVACTATLTTTAQMRFVEAADLNLIGKAQPTSHSYHRIDTAVYKGFTPEENQQIRCSAGLAVTFKTTSPRIDVWATYRYARRGDNTAGISDAGFDLYIRQNGQWLYAASMAPRQRGDAFTLIKDMDVSEKECLL